MTADSITTRADVDVRQDPAGTTWCARQFLAGQDPRDPYASPLYADLARPAAPVHPGRRLGHPRRRLRTASPIAARRAGVDVRLDVFPEMLHAHQIWAGNMPEADDAVARIGEYVRQRLALIRRRVVNGSATFPGVGVLYRATDEMPFLELARAADERGFTSLVLGEHTHIPVTSAPSNFPGGGDAIPRTYPRLLDPYVALVLRRRADLAEDRHVHVASRAARSDRVGQGARDARRVCRAGASRWAWDTAGTPTSS